MKEFIKKVLSDDSGNISSKRFVGVIGGIGLVVNMFVNPNEHSISCVLIISLGALGITGFEAIFKPK